MTLRLTLLHSACCAGPEWRKKHLWALEAFVPLWEVEELSLRMALRKPVFVLA